MWIRSKVSWIEQAQGHLVFVDQYCKNMLTTPNKEENRMNRVPILLFSYIGCKDGGK